ncbi:hypothetical protein FAZ69_05555 [Trinickia terrae]|uniref:Uncharacterized protein n=1 Tax=Trinickia terrae TaxID=2571161 RepID=A0A4V5PNH8_9BURK|nr:hypothetical protein FAZ69_05555 [Trinickia terrae]
MGDVGSNAGNGQFINLWELFAQIGEAETVERYEAAGYLVSCLDRDPTTVNDIRRRDEGIVLPVDRSTRLHLLSQLGIFANQATLFDADDMPSDDAQPTFERFGFYASDIYPFLARHDVAVSQPGGDGSEGRQSPDGRRIPSWIFAYSGQAWISRGRAAKILIAGTSDAVLRAPQYDDVFWRWNAALSDAVERGAIATTMAGRRQLLAHADIRTWCEQHGYLWLPDAQVSLQASPSESVSGDGDMAATGISSALAKTPTPRPLPQQLHQEQEILRALREHGFDPKKLPKSPAGKPGAKALVRRLLGWEGTIFDKAWERLRSGKEIADA